MQSEVCSMRNAVQTQRSVSLSLVARVGELCSSVGISLSLSDPQRLGESTPACGAAQNAASRLAI
jgi:hypothetical protein